jgi:hypothetical protein
MLTPYYLTRFVCASCGIFETATRDRPDPAARCPWCDEELTTDSQCRGATSRPLPFTSDPRLEDEPTDTSVDVINEQVSDRKRRRNHGNGKSTGRKPGKNVDRQEYQHQRYLRNKANNAINGTRDISGDAEG